MYDDMFDDEQNPKKEAETPAWMLTFADLVSLLICFFVLLYAMKSVDEDIWKKITGSFAGALNYSQKFKQVNPNNESGVEAEKILEADNMEYIESILRVKLSKTEFSDYINFYRDYNDNSLHITVTGAIMYYENSPELKPEGKKVLSYIAETVQYVNDDLEIANYVKRLDSIGRSTQFSMLRSLSAREFLVQKGANETIKVVGFGSIMYDSMKDIMTEQELNEKTEKLDFIIRSK